MNKSASGGMGTTACMTIFPISPLCLVQWYVSVPVCDGATQSVFDVREGRISFEV